MSVSSQAKTAQQGKPTLHGGSIVNLSKPASKAQDPDLNGLSREVLEAQLKVIDQNEAEAKKQEARELEQITFARKTEYHDLVKQAEHYEKLSVEATQVFDKKYYAQEAFDIRKRIEVQYPEFIPAISAEENTSTFSDKRSAWIQFGSLTALLLVFLVGFQIIRNYVLAFNAKILSGTSENNTATLMSSYGPDSFQKLFFEGIATCIDLFSLLGILFIISPTAFKYIIPFFNSKHDPEADFNHLNPWQRQLKSYLLLASVLLYLGLRHAVKP